MATARASSPLTSVWLGDCPCTRTPPVASAGLIQQAGAWTRRGRCDGGPQDRRGRCDGGPQDQGTCQWL